MKELELTAFQPLSYAGAEAINTLCTNLSFAGNTTKKIMFTSCHEAEGKSFTSINVMRTLSDLGYGVVLVDADLRRSRLKEKYGIHGIDLGLTHFLAGKAKAEDILYSTNIPGAYMVPAGMLVLNSLALLNSPQFGSFLNWLSDNFDYVIVDAPPVGAIIDAAQIAKSCDGMVIVVKYNGVTRKELIDVKSQMEQTKCPILGTALSMVQYDDYLSKKYYYKSYYSHYDSYYGKNHQGKHEAQQE